MSRPDVPTAEPPAALSRTRTRTRTRTRALRGRRAPCYVTWGSLSGTLHGT